MSVILLGDGNIFSSIAFWGSDTIILPIPALSPENPGEDNVDVIEGDGGWTVSYEKGTSRRIFAYRFTLLTDIQKEEIRKHLWQHVKGRLHWFTLQPHGQPVTDQFVQQYSGGSNQRIKNSILTQEQDYWRSWWVFVVTGAAQEQRRKITDFDAINDLIYVDPVFDNTVAVGDYVRLGIPVIFDQNQFEFTPRCPNFWDVTLIFRERVMS